MSINSKVLDVKSLIDLDYSDADIAATVKCPTSLVETIRTKHVLNVKQANSDRTESKTVGRIAVSLLIFSVTGVFLG